MVCAKNYETASQVVKVIPRKLLASFFRTRCKYLYSTLKSVDLELDELFT